MRTRAKVLLGALGVLLIVSAGAFLFLRHLVQKSHPVTSGVIGLPGLQAPVRVSRDPFGVPLIEAENDHDLLMAAGYVHAQDRLWQMDMTRRVALGRLSELLGAETVPYDRMFRILGLRTAAERCVDSMSAASLDRLAWYADGVNAFIRGARGRYPVEFDMLGYDPEPWLPLHTVLLGRLMAWELNLSWWTDVTLGGVAEKVGLEKALDVFPGYPPDVPPLVPAEVWRTYAGQGRGYMKAARGLRATMGMQGALGGSNAWVLGPSKTATGAVLLANDTHLQLQAPARFYEMHLRAPGVDVGGFSVPGAPVIIAGRNARIAWGLTNVMADDADFYIEQLDSVDRTRYRYDGGWRSLTVREEEILVRGDTAVPVTIRATHHGPVISDITTSLKEFHPAAVMTMRWTGADPSDPFEALTRINRAGTWEEFTAGVRLFAGPGMNFVYGDADGNIGYWCGARLPVRGPVTGTLPLPGWDPSAEWRGTIPFEELPHLFNPPEGYIASANNKLVDDSYPYHIGDLWEPPSRIERLREVLGPAGGFTAGDAERLQVDVLSPHARLLTPVILAALADSALGIPEERLIREYLRNWDFRFTEADVATSIYQAFTVRLLRNIYEDEMGEDLFHDFLILVNVPIRVTTRLLLEGTSSWFDDTRTPEPETAGMIIRRSMREAAADLRGRFGTGTKNWRWGDLHTVTLQHPFGLRRPLDRVFSIGPYPYGGGATTLVSGEYSYRSPFDVTVGASFRQVVEFSRPSETRRVLPGGQSGQVLHRHYDDQVHLWLHGGMRTFTAVVPADGAGWSVLRLEPAP